jgi:hypothetical protein
MTTYYSKLYRNQLNWLETIPDFQNLKQYIMNENWIEKIDKFLNGELNLEEKLAFESELTTNEELFSVFNLYGAIETEFQHMAKQKEEEAQLKNTLQDLKPTYFNVRTQPHTTC